MVRLMALILLIPITGCRPSTLPPRPQPDPAAAVARGQRLFIQVCAQCHGMNGEGVPSMGAPIPSSNYVAGATDAELLAFLKVGRPAQVDRPAMPPKGGRLDLTDADLLDIIAHMRDLQRAAPSTTPPTETQP